MIPTLDGQCELGDVAKKWRVVEGQTGEKFYVTRELDPEAVENNLLAIKQMGIDSISVALAHSYAYFEHEKQIGDIARKIG